jgi:ABC-2 type transport system permease protein
MRRFRVLLGKELRELLTLQMLLPIAVTVVMFALIGGLVGGQAAAGAGATVHVVDADRTAASARVAVALEDADFVVVSSPGTDPALLAAADRGPGTGLYIGIPAGFGAGLAAGHAQKLSSYTVMRNFSLFATADVGALNAAIDAIDRGVSLSMIASATASASPAALRDPVSLSQNVIVGTRSAPVTAAEVTGFITSQTTFIPIVLFIVIMFAASMIASTVASEKENKTLETLLATPVGRAPLVLAKMTAASLIALVSSAAYLFGMRYYMGQLSGGLGAGTSAAGNAVIARLGLTFGAGDYALLFLSLFTGILVALAIAVILGARRQRAIGPGVADPADGRGDDPVLPHAVHRPRRDLAARAHAGPRDPVHTPVPGGAGAVPARLRCGVAGHRLPGCVVRGRALRGDAHLRLGPHPHAAAGSAPHAEGGARLTETARGTAERA